MQPSRNIQEVQASKLGDAPEAPLLHRQKSAHGDVMVGFAIFHIVSFQKEKKRKKGKKGTPP
jgi:hypothetical protein